MKKVIRINTETGIYIEDVILQNGEVTPDDCVETPCPDGFYHPKWDEATQDFIEGAVIIINLDELKNSKLLMLNATSQLALQSFKYQDLTFEYSGSSKSDLIATMQFIQTNPSHIQAWFALDGTYKLGELDHIVINAENIQDFSNAFFNHAGAIFAWKETQKYYLEQATTVEEVELISTEYQEPIIKPEVSVESPTEPPIEEPIV